MIDWTNPTHLQLALAQSALMAAFPNPQNLDMMLLLRLGQSYQQLTAGTATYRYAVFQIVTTAAAEGWLEGLIKAARQEVPGNPRLKALVPLAELVQVAGPGGSKVEDIVRVDGGFPDVIPWIEKLDTLRKQVCRIERPVGQARGTGWLIGRDLIMTNWHVVRKLLSQEVPASEFTCRFDYAKNATETNGGQTVSFAPNCCVGSSPASTWELGEGDAKPTADDLDYAVIRLASAIGDSPAPGAQKRGWVNLSASTPVPVNGSILFVLQHPEGDPLKLAIGTAGDLNGSGSRIRHDANTLKGSSGSPCLNAKLELVALHNSGDPMYDDDDGPPKQNQGVPIGKILAKLAAQGAAKFWSD